MNQQTVNQSPESTFNGLYILANKTKAEKQILLDGYNELIDLLKTPGNIDKQTLMQSIGRTLKNAAK